MLKTDKERMVTELAERLRASETLIVADYRGLTHKEMDDVRTELLKAGAKFSVVKNTLTRRAAEEAGVEALLELLNGPTAIAFVHDGDMVAVAKALDETAKTTRRLSLKGGILSGRSVDAKGMQDLAKLPPAEVLRGQVLGAIVAPLTGLAALVNAPLQQLVGLIDARIGQLQQEGGEEEPAPESESAPAAPAESDVAAEAQDGTEAEPEAEVTAEAQDAAEPPAENQADTPEPDKPAEEGKDEK